MHVCFTHLTDHCVSVRRRRAQRCITKLVFYFGVCAQIDQQRNGFGSTVPEQSVQIL